jgi:hypothetical protein
VVRSWVWMILSEVPLNCISESFAMPAAVLLKG